MSTRSSIWLGESGGRHVHVSRLQSGVSPQLAQGHIRPCQFTLKVAGQSDLFLTWSCLISSN
jgi:hypothetical protein